MRVSCPNCDAAYEIPEQVLAAGGRRLRCARCAHEWAPAVPPPPQATADPDPPAVSAPPPLPAVPRPPADIPGAPLVASPKLTQDRERPDRRQAKAAVGWILTVVVLAGLSFAAYRFRQTVQEVWPPSTLVYSALGLA